MNDRDRVAETLGRVVVLMGGRSAERDVSLASGRAVLDALLRQGVDAIGFDPAERPLLELNTLKPDRAFIALHGRGGEDGMLQGALEWLGIPYTGSGVLGSALGMDKERTKHVWRSVGLPTPDSMLLGSHHDWQNVAERLGFPMVIKPVNEGSTLGLSIVHSAADLEQAWELSRRYDAQVMAERFIEGNEYTIAVLGDKVLPSIRVEAASGFYDYEAKYTRNDTLYHLPSGLSANDEAAIAELTRKAFDAAGARGWGRVDIMRDAEGQFWLLEINTSPGMTGHSLVPQAAAYQGIDFDTLVIHVAASASLELPQAAPKH